jgi:DNA polymerase (family X)
VAPLSPPPSGPPVPLGAARAAAARLLARLERNENALRLAVAGEVRRMAPWVQRLELLATAHEPAPLLDALAEAPRVAAVLARAERDVALRLEDGLEVHLRVLEDEDAFGSALLAATGPEPFVDLLRARAAAHGLTWRSDALRRGGEALPLPDEAQVFEVLGLDPMPPEQRDTHAPGAHVETLLTMPEVLGAAGLHARPGRGRYPLADMAARAAREGYAWALVVAEGEDAAGLATLDEAAAQQGAVDESVPTRLAVLRRDGAPQPKGALRLAAAPLDASLERALAVVEGTDALWLSAGDAPDAEAPTPGAQTRLLDRLARTGAALVVPPPPRHLRPEPDLLCAALERGVPLLLWADAHDLVALDDLVLAVGLARRAGARAEQVLNTRSLADFDAWIARRHAGAR